MSKETKPASSKRSQQPLTKVINSQQPSKNTSELKPPPPPKEKE